MTVDAQRVQDVFEMVLEAADPVQQAAILDRECGADAEFRQRVGALLKEHEDSTGIGENPGTTRFDAPLPSPAETSLLHPPIDPDAITTVSRQQNPEPADARREDDKAEIALDFLQPATKPGSLGRLGHYEVFEVLGRGAFGVVVRAFDEKLQRVVAIKLLASHLAATSPARKRFLREARASACVRHENVVQIYAVEEQPLPYLVMEYIPGQTLQQRLDQTGPLEAAEALRIGEQIASGLAAAHAQGLIHRDIKPGNILLERGIAEKVKITDFGLARAVDDASLTQSGVIAGTPLYMAPEQAKGETLDPRADLFSFGSVLYTMVSGRPPFRAPTALVVLKRVVEDTPRPIREIVPDVPEWLCDVVARLHAKDPAQRFQSAREVAVLFGQYLAHLQQPTLVARPHIVQPGQHSNLRRMAVVAAAVVVLAVVAAMLTYGPPWRSARPALATPELTDDKAPPTAQAEHPAADHPRSHVLQDPTTVSAALIDFAEPERRFGVESYANPLRRADQCNAFLVHFDLEKLGLAPTAHVAEAIVSFYVWDPSSSGHTKVCAFPLHTAWNPETVTWRQPAESQSWRGGAGFAFGADTGPAGSAVVVKPEEANDTAEPPIEYQLDVTDLARIIHTPFGRSQWQRCRRSRA